jgi:hypothetical protein
LVYLVHFMEDIRRILAKAQADEISALAGVLHCGADANSVVTSLQRTSVHVFRRWFGTPPTYKEILQKVADHIGVESRDLSNSDKELEQRILQRVWGEVWGNFSLQQREDFDRRVQQQLASSGNSGATKDVCLTGAGLLVANLGGFATYTLASTVVGTITGSLGITLPFAAYTGMSGIIAAVISPWGWVGLGLFALWKGRPDLDRVMIAVSLISGIRARQELTPAGGRNQPWIVALALMLGALLILALTLWKR